MNGEAKIPLPRSLQEIVGALIFASESPLTAQDVRQAIRETPVDEAAGDDENREVMEIYRTCTAREIDSAIRGLGKDLERGGTGLRLVCSGGAYHFETTPQCGRYVRSMLKIDRPSRLSRASLETLAIVAYRQPITKSEVEEIRGVAVDTIMKSLVELGLVRLVGRSELPGHPFLYGTTGQFLDRFGLSSLGELNQLDPTLQRSDPKERAKLFIKPKNEEETLFTQNAENKEPENDEAQTVSVPDSPDDGNTPDSGVQSAGDVLEPGE